MSEREIRELAAILVREHGHGALRVAESRRNQHARTPHSDSFRLWDRIRAATEHLLGRRRTSRNQRRGPFQEASD